MVLVMQLLQTWPCALWAQDSGICCLRQHFLLAPESPWSTYPELGTPEVPGFLQPGCRMRPFDLAGSLPFRMPPLHLF